MWAVALFYPRFIAIYIYTFKARKKEDCSRVSLETNERFRNENAIPSYPFTFLLVPLYSLLELNYTHVQ